MVNLIPTKTDGLKALLERLFPDTQISDAGVALLAAQITDLENRCAVIRSQIDFNARQMVEVNVLLARRISRKNKYGTNAGAK